jgi:hypothetical protein
MFICFDDVILPGLGGHRFRDELGRRHLAAGLQGMEDVEGRWMASEPEVNGFSENGSEPLSLFPQFEEMTARPL